MLFLLKEIQTRDGEFILKIRLTVSQGWDDAGRVEMLNRVKGDGAAFWEGNFALPIKINSAHVFKPSFP